MAETIGTSTWAVGTSWPRGLVWPCFCRTLKPHFSAFRNHRGPARLPRVGFCTTVAGPLRWPRTPAAGSEHRPGQQAAVGPGRAIRTQALSRGSDHGRKPVGSLACAADRLGHPVPGVPAGRRSRLPAWDLLSARWPHPVTRLRSFCGRGRLS